MVGTQSIVGRTNGEALTRRQAIRLSLGGAGVFSGVVGPIAQAVAGSQPTTGPAIPKWPQPNEVRQIWLRRQSTKESVIARYYDGRSIDMQQYLACCYILRDVQAGVVASIDVELLDLVFATQRWLVAWGIDRPLIVHSGHRSRTTNSKEGGAQNSMHLLGRALDFSIEGIPAEYMGRLSKIFAVGGVGFYFGRNFTHVDTGTVRYWSQGK